MAKEKLSQEFRLKNIEKRNNYFIKETYQNKLSSNKHKKASTSLNYCEHLLILSSGVIGYISISNFASLVELGKKKVTPVKFYSIFLNKICRFYDGYYLLMIMK